jgi:fructosamine-3-kinase
VSLSADLAKSVETALGAPVAESRPMGRGHEAVLWFVRLSDGRRLVVKQADGHAALAIEGFMLRHLREHSPLPVPAVHLSDDRLLVMDFVDGTSGLSVAAQSHAAELLADLHGRPVARYGFSQDTLIGPLPQPNPEGDDWVAFFRDHRLLHMARAAHDEGELGVGLLGRIERLAGRLDDLIGEPAPPALIHGDLWGGNVLVKGGRIAGLIDPAIYHADPEIELAFSTLFGTFGEPFFRRYREIRPLRRGFFEVRRDLYNLYPLLVHVRVFGGSYLGAVDRIVRRFAG